MTVAELLSRISSRELMEWQAYDRLEPVGSAGSRAFFLGFAIVAATIANANRTKKSQKVFEPEDFMPKFEKAEQSVGQQIQFAEMMTAAMSEGPNPLPLPEAGRGEEGKVLPLPSMTSKLAEGRGEGGG